MYELEVRKHHIFHLSLGFQFVLVIERVRRMSVNRIWSITVLPRGIGLE
jgi:hypothetical protein